MTRELTRTIGALGDITQSTQQTRLRGHNRSNSNRMDAIVFDFDTERLRQNYPGNTPANAYNDVKKYLTSRSFEWKQGSTYFGDDTIDAVRCVRVVQKMAARCPWFTASLSDIRMLRIEENSDLLIALDDQDDD